MTKPHLVPCAACARHVRVSEGACPFCGAALPASLRDALPPQGPATRLTRAALFAFGTGALVAAPACSSNSGNSEIPLYGGAPISDATASDDGNDGEGRVAPPYGAFPIGDAIASDDGNDGQVTTMALYGGAVLLDGGFDADAADGANSPDAADAESTDDGAPKDAALDHVGVAPAYGIAAH